MKTLYLLLLSITYGTGGSKCRGAWGSEVRGVRRCVVFEGAWCSKARGVQRRMVFGGVLGFGGAWGAPVRRTQG
jgi:hypothetical protein